MILDSRRSIATPGAASLKWGGLRLPKEPGCHATVNAEKRMIIKSPIRYDTESGFCKLDYITPSFLILFESTALSLLYPRIPRSLLSGIRASASS